MNSHFIHTVHHVHILNHGYFTDIVSALGRSRSMTLTCGKNIEKDTTNCLRWQKSPYHGVRRHTTGVYFILFYSFVIKYNDPAVKIWPGRVRGNRQSFYFGLIRIYFFCLLMSHVYDVSNLAYAILLHVCSANSQVFFQSCLPSLSSYK